MSDAAVSLNPKSEIPLFGAVYGPVESRRWGLSLGINPLGEKKICSFDCVYCDLGATSIRMNQIKKDVAFPSVEEIDSLLRTQLRLGTEHLKSLTLSGNGEPTLYPQFLELTEALVKARGELAPHLPLRVLTNAAHIDSRRMVQALDMYDERVVKVDAGSDALFKKINNPLSRASLTKVINGARKLKNCSVQSLFVQGRVDNTSAEVLEEWIEVVGIIQPKEVQLYTLRDHRPSNGLLPASEDTLYTIASKLKRRTQLEAKVFA
jgi:wyosine [tRNA(Phe)-imidazoG37] synthetase (radical SAM superfamily)